jgi:hypothetical protein
VNVNTSSGAAGARRNCGCGTSSRRRSPWRRKAGVQWIGGRTRAPQLTGSCPQPARGDWMVCPCGSHDGRLAWRRIVMIATVGYLAWDREPAVRERTNVTETYRKRANSGRSTERDLPTAPQVLEWVGAPARSQLRCRDSRGGPHTVVAGNRIRFRASTSRPQSSASSCPARRSWGNPRAQRSQCP